MCFVVHFAMEDHPHACGDKKNLYIKSRQEQGSSPRVWGQALKSVKLASPERIIPTRVGTRRLCLLPWSRTRDHPHACGDKLVYDDSLSYNEGSSPRVWGQGYARIILKTRNRIIPTRVGTSKYLNAKSLYPRDHPHACGDK